VTPPAPADGDGDWVVRPVRGQDARKVYRCPGCDHEIRVAQPHVVAWPAYGWEAETERRHWHTACWRARHRKPQVRRA
jgi:hypothetical protein